MKSFVNSEKFDCLDQQLMSAKAFNAPPVSELHRLLEVFQTEQYDEAERSARTLIAQFPKHNFGWKILAAVLKKTGKVSESVFAGEKTVELNPDDAESHYNLGNTFELLRRLDEAEAEYKQAITLQADYAEAHNNLGKMLKELGRFDEAETSLKHAISLKPDFFEALNNLGNSLSMMGRLEEAEASYRKAIALSPDYEPPHGNLGSLLLKLGKHQEGLNEQMIGEGLITFDLKHGLFII
jgi:Flp pilus assembly protein TadD